MNKTYFISNWNNWITSKLPQYNSVYDAKICSITKFDCSSIIFTREEVLFLKLRYPELILLNEYDEYVWVKFNDEGKFINALEELSQL